jgi:hypothetical protein
MSINKPVWCIQGCSVNDDDTKANVKAQQLNKKFGVGGWI